MTEQVDQEMLAAFAADLLSGSDRDAARAQVGASEESRALVEEYQAIVREMRLWQVAPQDAVGAATHVLLQRIRLHRLLGEFVSNPSLRRQAAQNPETLLRAHGVVPTPQLLAAFKELDVTRLERAPGELDERITKLFNLLG